MKALCTTLMIAFVVSSMLTLALRSHSSGATTDGNDSGVISSTATGLQFSDQTIAANLMFSHTTYAQTELNMMISGAAVGDFNNDGWDDLFVLGGGVVSDALFINQGDGTYTDQAPKWGVAIRQRGAGVAVADYNNDGWQDLFITSHGISETAAVGYHRLYKNNQGVDFVDVATEAGVNLSSSSLVDGFGSTFGDYDLDGDLDLFVTGWRSGGKGNRLFRNNRDGTFTDITENAGPFNNGLRGFSPCFADMDGDRYPELLVAGDFNSSRYFVNNRDGTFTDQSLSAGIKLPAYGMGSALGDFNNDGFIDWYITSIYRSSFGGAGNRLFMNQGNHSFRQIAAAAGVDDGRWGWGAVAVDLNNDRWVDIVETNGWPLEPQFKNQPSRMWINQGNETFIDVATESGFIHNLEGRGLLNFDYDKDGDQDILITSNNDQLKLFRNDLVSTQSHWLQVRLDTHTQPALAPNGIGARVEITIGDSTYVQLIGACSNFLSQSEMSAHFGLGTASIVDVVRVIWPNGQSTSASHLAANQIITLVPPQTVYLPFISN